MSELAGSIRELIEVVVRSVLTDSEVKHLSRQVRLLSAGIAAVPQRPEDDRGFMDDGGRLSRLYGPMCGPANPLAPPIRVERAPVGVRAEFTMSRQYEGPEGATHGGICAAVLDDLLTAAVAMAGYQGLTATLSLRYIRPTPLYVPLVAEAAVTRAETWAATATGRILDPCGQVTIAASGVFRLPSG